MQEYMEVIGGDHSGSSTYLNVEIFEIEVDLLVEELAVGLHFFLGMWNLYEEFSKFIFKHLEFEVK